MSHIKIISKAKSIMKYGSNIDLLELENSLRILNYDFSFKNQGFLCSTEFRGVSKHLSFNFCSDFDSDVSLVAIVTHAKSIIDIPFYRMDNFQKGLYEPSSMSYITNKNYNFNPSYLNMSFVQNDCINLNRLNIIEYKTGLNSFSSDLVFKNFYKFINAINIQTLIDKKCALMLYQNYNKKFTINLYDHKKVINIIGEEKYVDNFEFYNKYIFPEDKKESHIALDNYIKISNGIDIDSIDLVGFRENDYIDHLICTLSDY